MSSFDKIWKEYIKKHDGCFDLIASNTIAEDFFKYGSEKKIFIFVGVLENCTPYLQIFKNFELAIEHVKKHQDCFVHMQIFDLLID